MKEYLESLGILGAENLAARLAYAIWSAIDWQSPLWKTAGHDCYNRFEARVRTAGRQRSLSDFVSALGRRCHVSVPVLDAIDRADMESADAAEILRLARDNSGLTVATMRLWLEQRREMRQSSQSKSNQPDVFGGVA